MITDTYTYCVEATTTLVSESSLEACQAAAAAAEELPLFTTDPDDFKGLGDLITIVPVTLPEVLHDRWHHA